MTDVAPAQTTDGRAFSVLSLADGRGLAYAEYGDPAGRPVLYCHGGLASRLDVAPLSAAFADQGVRLISPDRPGIGHSSYQRHRTLLDWPADVAQLADALGMGRFATVGWSAGGPYALACGHALADRVSAVAVLGTALPFEVVGTRKGLNRPDRIMLTLATRVPPVARATLWLTMVAAPAQALERSAGRALSPADRAVLASAGSPAEAVAFMKESVRQGTRGEVAEYVVFARPWGFALEDIPVPVHVWEGAEDKLLPPAYPRILLEHLPGATFTMVPGEGHISLLRNRLPEIVAALLDAD
jgi:pimeloyl-ACP methyl ester carboxylesterase